MTSRIVSGLALILLWTGSAHGQHRLNKAIFEPISKGVDRLTEEEALKLVPGPVTVSFEREGYDCVLRWEEVSRIRVEFLDGKTSTATGTFSDVVASKILTPANLKKIAKGMSQQDVEKLLAVGGTSMGHLAKNFEGKDIQVSEWIQGRVITAFIKDGKVKGCAFIDSGQ